MLKSLARRLLGWPEIQDIQTFATDPSEREALLQGAKSDLERLFYGTRGRLIHKWVHYLGIYERHFASLRGKPLTILEIGVYKGGSLELWRNYFGPDAVIFGIDIDPECATHVDPPNQVRIGSQADPAFLASVIGEMGAPDIVLDDGSHVASHQMASFRALFPALRDGGLYMIEDTHTSYWRRFGGGFRRKGTAIELAKQIIDEMHGWYRGKTVPDITGLYVYDSIIVIEKGKVEQPRHIQVD